MIVREPEQKYGPPAPVGVHAAVCVDEIDLGLVPNKFDPTQDPAPTVRLVWQIAEDQPNGEPYEVHRDYRASLHEKAALRKDLESWRGRPFNFDELVGFDLENVVGVHCMINMVEKMSQKGKKYTTIAAIMPLAKGMIKLAPRDYVRHKNREVAEAIISPPPPNFDDLASSDDDVPF
jgi:hypothetical protein